MHVIYLQEQVPQMQGNPNVKRKVAVLIAYNGKGYHGIQRWLRYFCLQFHFAKLSWQHMITSSSTSELFFMKMYGL